MKKFSKNYVLKYLIKHRKQYNKYFKNKNLHKTFFCNLDKESIKYCKHNGLQISLQEFDISNKKINKKDYRKKMFKKTNKKTGWSIAGVLQEDWALWVDDFFAFHPRDGCGGWTIYGDFNTFVYATDEKALHHFLNNNPPVVWSSHDI